MYSDFEMNINSLLKSQPPIRKREERSIIATKAEGSKVNAAALAVNSGTIVPRKVINIRDVKTKRPSIYSKYGTYQPVKQRSVGIGKKRPPSKRKASADSFIAYLFQGNNLRVLAVSVSIILLLALCSFALNANDPLQSEEIADHTYSFMNGGDDFSASNPAFAVISEHVSFTITDGIAEPKTVSVLPAEVGVVFSQLGIVIGEEDIVNYDLRDIVTDGINIIILRTDSKTSQVSEEIPFETQIIEVDTIKKGTTQVVRKGITGLRIKYYEQNYTNDVLDEEIKTGEKVLKEAVTEIIYKGVGGTFKAPDGKTYSYSYVLDVEATAYGDVSGGKNPKWNGITYTGTQVRPGVIAVDPNVISLNSAVYVTGEYGDYGLCSAEDTGSAVKGNIIDLYMESKEEMVKFGRRAMKAYILE